MSIYDQGCIDVNNNGKKDVYEDPKQHIANRVEDLLGTDDCSRKGHHSSNERIRKRGRRKPIEGRSKFTWQATLILSIRSKVIAPVRC